jgi:MFS family permease
MADLSFRHPSTIATGGHLAPGVAGGQTQDVSEPSSERAPERGTPLARRALLLVGALVGIVVAYFIAAATIPRWWAQRVADQVDGSIAAGTGLGLFYGFVFTFLSLLVLSFALRRGRSWRVRAWLVGAAILLALPNLMTLGIVLGTGSAAHAGERILDVEGPNFRAFSLVGAIIGAAAVVGVRYLMLSRRRAKGRASELDDELRRRREADARAAEAEEKAAERGSGA